MDIETFLARLYADDAFRAEFVASPHEVALREGLGEEDAKAFARMDFDGLALAAASYERKRTGRRKRR